jgi:hypothetical protein
MTFGHDASMSRAGEGRVRFRRLGALSGVAAAARADVHDAASLHSLSDAGCIS